MLIWKKIKICFFRFIEDYKGHSCVMEGGNNVTYFNSLHKFVANLVNRDVLTNTF